MVKEESSITELRIAFDRLVQSCNGISLNVILLTGPLLTNLRCSNPFIRQCLGAAAGVECVGMMFTTLARISIEVIRSRATEV